MWVDTKTSIFLNNRTNNIYLRIIHKRCLMLIFYGKKKIARGGYIDFSTVVEYLYDLVPILEKITRFNSRDRETIAKFSHEFSRKLKRF